MEPFTAVEKVEVANKVQRLTTQYLDGLITFGEWQQAVVEHTTSHAAYATWEAEQHVERATDELRTVVVIRHKDKLGRDDLQGYLAQAIHEGHEGSLLALHDNVTSIDSPDCLSD